MAQLRKYRDNGVTRLVAVTKSPPAFDGRQLRKFKIRTLRWQDVHRAMGDLYRPTPVDRFLCSSFAKYLEQTGMAYDEELTRGELMDLQRVLDYVAGDRIKDLRRSEDSESTIASCSCCEIWNLISLKNGK